MPLPGAGAASVAPAGTVPLKRGELGPARGGHGVLGQPERRHQRVELLRLFRLLGFEEGLRVLLAVAGRGGLVGSRALDHGDARARTPVAGASVAPVSGSSSVTGGVITAVSMTGVDVVLLASTTLPPLSAVVAAAR